MADIQNKILDKYGFDISQDNIFKLYKIESPDISSQDLEVKIQDTRKRWTTSINGANERNAERDRARLNKADKYEAVLKDAKLRKEVFGYYNKSSGAGGGGASSSGGSTEFAKEYFELVATTKKIKKEDVDFFFDYYQSERKNRKAIIEMLSKEMRVLGLGKEENYGNEGAADDIEGNKKNDADPLIVNLFEKATILKIRKAFDKFRESGKSDEICQRYPGIRDNLFDFLGMEEIGSIEQYTEIMNSKSNEVYTLRQDRGTEYVPLVDLFNLLKTIGSYRDVKDNFLEFKLLIKYPNLTPYMFAFYDMKPKTVKGIVNVAKREYSFRDDTDFILNYYNLIHKNFRINDSGISSILNRAEKKAKQNKILKGIDEKLGLNRKKKVPLGAMIIHWLLYWPIFAVYFVFEVAKAVFTELHRFAMPLAVILFLLESWLLPKIGFDNLLILRKLFFKKQWLEYLGGYGMVGRTATETVQNSLILITLLASLYLLLPFCVSVFISEFASDFNKRFDWGGHERTFQNIFMKLEKKTENQYNSQKNLFFKNKMGKVFMNMVCLISLIAIIIFTPVGLRKLSKTTGYFYKEPEVTERDFSYRDESEEETETSTEIEKPVGETMIITVKSGNIRSGPGTDYDVVKSGVQGEKFISTGNQEVTSSGSIWYEIYIDDDMSMTGWASQKIIDFE
ncbi:SH3 domain-containing protein [Oribacterium sp. FC2011]|uniref:SH3 domain-containing protein n=1 Tax=Oribacterium sp. FC2011 TaxID=1408311 RepID=UPI0004E18739|nr:SH3 domain-containing protein [Oribacterium sp. FC2011]